MWEPERRIFERSRQGGSRLGGKKGFPMCRRAKCCVFGEQSSGFDGKDRKFTT
jgi:hypothetical protein